MRDLTSLRFTRGTCEGPCFYRYEMTVHASSTANADTFLDTRALSKGVVFLNGQPLGRFWSIGPEFTLYTPGPWLHAGSNEVTLFDLQGSKTETLKTTNHADYGVTSTRDNPNPE